MWTFLFLLLTEPFLAVVLAKFISMFIRICEKLMFEIPALIPIRSPFRSLCTQWPSFGMYIFLGYTVVGVTLRLLACALAGDSGLLSLHHCAFISP